MKIDLSKQELANIVDALRYWILNGNGNDDDTVNVMLSDQHQLMLDRDLLILIARLTEAHNHDLP